VRFNKKGGFNVPFCKKEDRFRPAYITKICNQVDWVSKAMYGKDWKFLTQDWKTTLNDVAKGDFVYLDPPYVGRHTDYFNSWSDADANMLAESVKELSCGFAYSMWKKNDYRVNQHLIDHFSDYPCLIFNHFYHVGSSEDLRNPMEEALIVPTGSLVHQKEDLSLEGLGQIALI